MIKRLILLCLLLAAVGGVGAYYLVPWNAVLEKQVVAFLSSKGINNIAFKIDKVGLHQATVNNIIIGKENPLLLNSVTVQYNPRELMDGTLQDLTLKGLDIQVLETDTGWKIAGMDGLPKSDREGPSMTFSDIVNIIPFSSIKITDSHLRINGKNIQTSLPFAMTLSKGAQTNVEMIINAANLTAAASEISLGIITINAAPDDKQNWNGKWTLESLDFGEALPIPVMAGAGNLAYTGSAINLDGGLSSSDQAYVVNFKGLYDTKASDKNAVTIVSVKGPFKEGIVSAKNIIIPLAARKNLTINVDIQKVSLDALLQTLTGKRVTATGTVSGSIPVIIKKNGSYGFGKGSLKADNTGLIQMPGDVIPGDNEQVVLVRQIVENLHYSLFSAAVETTGGKGMVVKLSLEGNNPDVYNGRPVKLNVNLTGDVLDFIQQNAMLFTNPEKLLKQGTE